MADTDFRAWAKLLKSKNTDKLLEGLSHCNDFAFISSGGGLVPLMNLLDAKKTNKDVLLGAAGALAQWAAGRHGLAILRHGARKNTHWTGLEKFVKLLHAKSCEVELAVSVFTTIGAVAKLVNAMPRVEEDPSSQRAQYRARLGEMSVSMPTIVPFLRHADATVRERAIRALVHLTIPASGEAPKYDHCLCRQLRQAAIDAGSVSAALSFLHPPAEHDAGRQPDDGPHTDDGTANADVVNVHWQALGLLANLTADVAAQHKILAQGGGVLLASVLSAEVELAASAVTDDGAGADNPTAPQGRASMSTALKAAVVVVTRVTCLALTSRSKSGAASPCGCNDGGVADFERTRPSTEMVQFPAMAETLPETLVRLLNTVSEMSLSPESVIPALCATCESIGRLGTRAAGAYDHFLSACALPALLNVFEQGEPAARESAEKALHVLAPFLEVAAPADGDVDGEGPGFDCVVSVVKFLQHTSAEVRCGAVRLATAFICRIDDGRTASAFARSGCVAPLLELLGERSDMPRDGARPGSTQYETAAHAAMCLARLACCDERACATIGADLDADVVLRVLLSGAVTPAQYAQTGEVEDTVLRNPAIRSWGVHAIDCVVVPSLADNSGECSECELSVNIRAVFLDLLAAVAEGDALWRKFDDVNVESGGDEEDQLRHAPPSSSNGEAGALVLFEMGSNRSSADVESEPSPHAGDIAPTGDSVPSVALALLDNSRHAQVRLAAVRLLTALPTIQVGNGRRMLMQVLLGIGNGPQCDVLPTEFFLPTRAAETKHAPCAAPGKGERCAPTIARLVQGITSILVSQATSPDEIWPAIRLLASLCRDSKTRVPDLDCRQPVMADLMASVAVDSGVLVMLISLLHSAPMVDWAEDFIIYLICRGCVREAFWKVSEEKIQVDGEVVLRTMGHQDPNRGPTMTTWSTLLDTKSSYERYCHSSRTALHAAVSSGNAAIARSLLGAGALVNMCDNEGVTPLILAVNSGSDSLARCLIDAGADYDAVTRGGDNVLKYAFLMPGGEGAVRHAVSSGGPKLIADLLHIGADPNIADENGNHPLHWVLAGARIRCVVSFCLVDIVSKSTELLDSVATLVGAGAQVNVCNRVGQTPLHIALRGGHVAEATALVLKYGTDPNVADTAGNLPLHYACASPAFEPLVRILLTAGATRPIRRGAFVDLGRGLRQSEKLLRSLNVVLMDGLRAVLSPPAIAERQASKEDILESCNRAGATAIHAACGGWAMLGIERAKRVSCVINDVASDLEERCRILCSILFGEYGCNPDSSRRAAGEATALHILSSASTITSGPRSEVKSFVRIICGELTKITPLIIEARSDRGRSCLSLAFDAGSSGSCSSLASYLLHKGAVGETGLYAACTADTDSEIITRCLGDASAVHHDDSPGKCALHVAASAGNSGAVRAILSRSASSINRVDMGGNSSLHLASSLLNDGGLAVASVLVNSGCEINALNSSGKTALHEAIGRSNVGVAALLVKNDPSWNLPCDLHVPLLFLSSPFGRTALAQAERRNISLACSASGPTAKGSEEARFQSLLASDNLVKFLLVSLNSELEHQHMCFAKNQVLSEWETPVDPLHAAASADEKALATAATKVQSSYRGHRERRRKRRHQRRK